MDAVRALRGDAQDKMAYCYRVIVPAIAKALGRGDRKCRGAGEKTL